ncbi:MAG: hypothetical protein AAGC74_11715, partial [Verrucomicrobiota bacterium]
MLLVPVTMLGVTFLVFMITRVVPGGPLEQQLQAAQAAAAESGGNSSGEQGALDEESIEALEEEYGYDLPHVVAYLQWLGVVPRERLKSKKEFGAGGVDRIGGAVVKDPETEALLVLKGVGREVLVKAEKKTKAVKNTEWVEKEGKIVRDRVEREVEEWVVKKVSFVDDGSEAKDWKVEIESPHDRLVRWAERNRKPIEAAPRTYAARAVAYRPKFAGLLQGDLGTSRSFGDPVWTLIRERIPIALYFGILTTIIT